MYPLTGSLLLIISTSFLSIYTCSAQDLVIHVDAINGEDTESCVQGTTPCATINMALKGLNFNGTTTLYISPGNYTLEYGIFNNISGDVGSSIAIIGSGEQETIVECDPGAGLNITSLYEVTIQSITFIGCGFENELQISIKVYLSSSIYGFSYILTIAHVSSATLTFMFCLTISVNNVTILSSNGSGIIMMDSEKASVIGCTVSSGYYLDSYSDSLAVGGIVHLSSDIWIQSKLSIAHSTITDNYYLLGNEDCRVLKATGALVVVGAETLEIDIDSCLIANNSRALFSYHPYCDSCSYVFNSSVISNNQNASSITSYETYYQLNVLMIDSELADSHPLIINLPRSTSVSSTSFSSTNLFNSYILQKSSYSRVNVTISIPHKVFSFDFHEVEECIDYELQTECIGIDCLASIYSVCSVKEGECSYSNCQCYDNHYYNNETNNCGECIEGYSVAINSPYLECVPCNSSLVVLKGWAILIVMEFIPLTIMIALIAILNVNLNQGSLKAYILFCQLFTIPIPSAGYPSWIELHKYTNRFSDFFLIPFAIWNLGFISFSSCNLYSGGNECYDKRNNCSDLAICISQNTTPLGAIAFWYVIVFYPFLLLASLYGYVIMYNKGYRCVVCTGRPVHRLLARFWRTFNIQPSFSHTVASVYMLCFTQLVAISLKLLQWNWVDRGTESYEYDFETVFFYDSSQKYFDKAHSVAFFAGLFVLVIFVFFPVTYICVYPFKWFQKCFNKLKFKKDLLISVTDVFIGPYKNGTSDTWDYRYFAGLAFALQLSQLILLCFPLPFIHYVDIVFNANFVQACHISLSGLHIIFIVLFRPYKKIMHCLTEIIFHLFLIGFSVSPLLNTCIGKFDSVENIVVACMVTLYFFLLIVCIYCFIWIVKKVKFAVFHRWVPHRTRQRQQLINDNEEDTELNTVEEDDGEFADRLMNPQSYNERHVPNMPLDNGENLTAPYKRI